MKYIEENEQTQELITKFLEENNFTVSKINFEDDSALVFASENDELLNEIYGYSLQSNFRSIVLFASIMSPLGEEMNILERLFVVNDFEFYSTCDLEGRINLNLEWQAYLLKSLPPKEKDAYFIDLQTFIDENIFEN